MGNWSCLYHWFEFNKKSDADKGYHILLNSYKEYDWIDKSKSALKIGYINNKVIQAVTSQKWGLDTDFTSYIYQRAEPVAAINAGIDSEECFQILGKPVYFTLNWNYIFIPDKKIDINKITSFDEFHEINISEKFNRKSLIFKKVHSFEKPFLDENDLEKDKLLKKIINLFNPLFNKSNINYLEQNDGFEIIFGQHSIQYGDINFGTLTFYPDHSFNYITNGSYNILQKEKIFGEYKTPILDEPILIL